MEQIEYDQEDDSVEVLDIQEVDLPFDDEEVTSESRTKCGDVFIDGEQLFTLVCGICEDEYRSLDLFGKHIVSKHVVALSVDVPSDLETTEILEDKSELNSQCRKIEVAPAAKDGSNKKLKADENRTKKQLQSRRYDVESIFLCTVCGRKFSKKEKLFAHIDSEHYRTSLINESEKNNVGSKGKFLEGKGPGGLVLTSSLAEPKGRPRKSDTCAKKRSQISLSICSSGMLDNPKTASDHCGEKEYCSDSVSGQSKFTFDEKDDFLVELNNFMTPCTSQSNVPSKTLDNGFVREFLLQRKNALSDKNVKKLSEPENESKHGKGEATSEMVEATIDLEVPYICDKCGLRYRNEKLSDRRANILCKCMINLPELTGLAKKEAEDVIVSEGQEIVPVHEDSVEPQKKIQPKQESDSDVDDEDEFFKPVPTQLTQRRKAGIIYSCSECGHMFRHYRSYQAHVKRNDCNKRPSRRKRRIRAGPTLVIEKKPKAPEPFTCEYCQEKFDAKKLFEEHVRLAHGILLSKRFVKRECRFCGEVCAGKRGLEEHTRKAHPDKELDACEYCGKRFNRPRVLREHLNVHLGIKPYQCPHCPTAFVSQSNLVNHIRVHLQIKNHKCTYCDKRFVTTTDKKIHELSHTGERNHQCSECGKLYPTPTRLNDHMRRHLNIKNFKCQVCDRAFYSSTLLANHHLTHSEPRYECHLCGKRVKRITTLRNHMNLHGDEKYSCPVCKKTFSNFSTLRAHHKTHNEIDDTK